MVEAAKCPTVPHPMPGTAGQIETNRDTARDSGGTVSLKALATKRLGRDTARDSGGTPAKITVPRPETPVGHFSASVPPVLNASDDLAERTAIIEEGAGVPREWAEGFAQLSIMPPPEGVPVHRWRQLIDNAGRFLDHWGAQAATLGWDVASVFSCHARKPDVRLDLQGLVWLVGDGELVAITEGTARVKTKVGVFLTYRRRPANSRESTVAVWELARTP
jgi:hypothetical protein